VPVLAASEAQICSSKSDVFQKPTAPDRPEHLFQGRINPANASSPGRADVGEAEIFVMLSWVVTFLIIALVAGILGFGGIAGVSIEIAKTIFFIAVVLFLVSAVIGLARGRTRV
jgi:uncharacterized membrane protein YtjA (UPF0391 family)